MIKLASKHLLEMDELTGKVDLHTAVVVSFWDHVIPLDHMVVPSGMKYKMEVAAYLSKHIPTVLYKVFSTRRYLQVQYVAHCAVIIT